MLTKKQSARFDTGNLCRRLRDCGMHHNMPQDKPTPTHQGAWGTQRSGWKQRRNIITESSVSVVAESAADQLKKSISLINNHEPGIVLTRVSSCSDDFPDDKVVDSMNTGYPSQLPFSSEMEIFQVHYYFSPTADSPDIPTIKNCILHDDSAINLSTFNLQTLMYWCLMEPVSNMMMGKCYKHYICLFVDKYFIICKRNMRAFMHLQLPTLLQIHH